MRPRVAGIPCKLPRGCEDARENLDAVIEESHRALDAFLKGDPAPLQALFSQSEDVTLANPFGPAQRGWPQVRDTMARAAAHYRDGHAVGFDQLAKHVSVDVACIHELSDSRRRWGQRSGHTDLAALHHAFRREEARWKIVHRHADPIASAQAPDSVIQHSP